MSGQMLGEVVGAGEAFSARFAMVRPLTGVYAQVARQIGLAAESASAKKTNERSLAGVLADMQFEVLLGAYAFPTKRASEARCWRSRMKAESQNEILQRLGLR